MQIYKSLVIQTGVVQSLRSPVKPSSTAIHQTYNKFHLTLLSILSTYLIYKLNITKKKWKEKNFIHLKPP